MSINAFPKTKKGILCDFTMKFLRKGFGGWNRMDKKSRPPPESQEGGLWDVSYFFSFRFTRTRFMYLGLMVKM